MFLRPEFNKALRRLGGRYAARPLPGSAWFCQRFDLGGWPELCRFLLTSRGGPLVRGWSSLSLDPAPRDPALSILNMMSDAQEGGYDGRMWIPVFRHAAGDRLVARNDRSMLAGLIVHHAAGEPAPDLVFARSLFDALIYLFEPPTAGFDAAGSCSAPDAARQRRAISFNLRGLPEERIYWCRAPRA